jgi:hypothetical protein
MSAVRRWRAVAGALAGSLLVAGCSTAVAGHGDYLEGLGTVTATSTVDSPEPAPPPPTSTTPTAAPTAAPGTVPASFGGTWRGQVKQPTGVVSAWTAQLVLPVGRQIGTFTVVSLCSGIASVVSASPSRLVLLEVIASDPQNRCAASGTITLQRTAANRAKLRWVDTDHPDNTATGNLSKL